MDIKVVSENGRVPVTVIRIEGNIDTATYEAFLSKVKEHIQGGARYILLDLSKTTFVSSAGLRAMNQIFNELRALHPDTNLSEQEVKQGIAAGTYKSPHLKLLNPSNGIKKVFEMTGFDMFIESFNDMKAAINSF